jgi:hypothetical protein
MKISSIFISVALAALAVTGSQGSQIDPAYIEVTRLCVYTEAHSADLSVARTSEIQREGALGAFVTTLVAERGWGLSVSVRKGCWEPTPKQMTFAFMTGLRRDPLDSKRIITASWFRQWYENAGSPQSSGPVEIGFCNDENLDQCLASQATEYFKKYISEGLDNGSRARAQVEADRLQRERRVKDLEDCRADRTKCIPQRQR